MTTRSKVVVVVLLIIAGSVATLSVWYAFFKPPNGLLAHAVGEASARHWYGVPFSISRDKLGGEDPYVSIHLGFEDEQARVAYYVYACVAPNCIQIRDDGRGFDIGEIYVKNETRTPVEAGSSESSELRLRLNLQDTGLDQHFHFVFLQTVNSVPNANYEVVITLQQ